MSALKLGHIGMGTGVLRPFDQVFDMAVKVNILSAPSKVQELDAVVVWGGADISPSIYKEPVSHFTHATEKMSARDAVEVRLIELALQYDKPIIGVCRGAQLACAMAGGKLIQHVEGHHTSHPITTKDGRSIVTSSVHHQMMYPWDVEHDLIAWSTRQLSKCHIMGNEEDIQVDCEPEIVYFPGIRALAIQGHPEFMDDDCEFVKYCNDLVRTYLLKETVNVAA